MTTPVRTTVSGVYPESATAMLNATITDVDGVTPLADADTILLSLTLTLYHEGAWNGGIVNDCLLRDILNANGGTVSSAGALSVRLDPDDMAIVGADGGPERHIALLVWTWGSPVKTGRHQVTFVVSDLAKVT